MAKKKTKAKKQASFEDLMTRLEEIAGELESGELGLEKAIGRYEEGVKCYKQCHRILSNAEKKVEILTKGQNEELRAEPFGETDDEGEAAEDDAGAGEADEGSASLF